MDTTTTRAVAIVVDTRSDVIAATLTTPVRCTAYSTAEATDDAVALERLEAADDAFHAALLGAFTDAAHAEAARLGVDVEVVNADYETMQAQLADRRNVVRGTDGERDEDATDERRDLAQRIWTAGQEAAGQIVCDEDGTWS